MSYQATEESALGGKPVEAVHFHVNGVDYRYSSAATALTIGGDQYTPIAMGREAFTLSADSVKSDLTINLPRDIAVAYVSGLTSVTVHRGHGSDFVTYWKGRVIGREFMGQQATFRCESIFTSMKRPGLRAKYQLLCRHVLFGEGCEVVKASYLIQRAIQVISGTTITVDLSAVSAGWLLGGFVSSGPYSRMIIGQSGDTIQIDRLLPDLAVDDVIDIYPGCDHTTAHCQDKFSNLINYGGFPWIPLASPFAGLGNSLV